MKIRGRIFKKRPKPKPFDPSPDVTEEEILSMVNEGSEQGSILSTEAEMVQNVFRLDDKSVKDIMVHRNDIVAIDENTMLRDAIDRFQKYHFSRFPVYRGTIDSPVGVIHIKDILDHADRPEEYQTKICAIPDLIHPVETVPETHGINTLFTTMQLEKTHMAIVVDEYGQTSGIVTMEDILEEIVGNIQDEHDDERESVEDMGHDVYRMEGRTPLSEVSEILGKDFTSDDIDTLNGYLTNELGRVPKEHERFTITRKGFSFHVLDVRGRVIREVDVTPAKTNKT